MTVPTRPSVAPVIPEDVIERAARAWERDFESCGPTYREDAMRDAEHALRASGLPARVAELEAAIARHREAITARTKPQTPTEPDATLWAALNAKGAE